MIKCVKCKFFKVTYNAYMYDNTYSVVKVDYSGAAAPKNSNNKLLLIYYYPKNT